MRSDSSAAAGRAAACVARTRRRRFAAASVPGLDGRGSRGAAAAKRRWCVRVQALARPLRCPNRYIVGSVTSWVVTVTSTVRSQAPSSTAALPGCVWVQECRSTLYRSTSTAGPPGGGVRGRLSPGAGVGVRERLDCVSWVRSRRAAIAASLAGKPFLREGCSSPSLLPLAALSNRREPGREPLLYASASALASRLSSIDESLE